VDIDDEEEAADEDDPGIVDHEALEIVFFVDPTPSLKTDWCIDGKSCC